MPTLYASWLDGVILSPWIEGHALQRFDAAIFEQVFSVIVALELAGFFEWDLCHRNIVEDGQRITLFDFGYMYRFDPLRHFNNNGLATPLFFGIERFETRAFFDHLLHNPSRLEEPALLALYRLEKEHALAHYEAKHAELTARAAAPEVLIWQAAINARWRHALRSPEALQRLYLVESFRSHVLDLLDDVHGKTCTPRTLARADRVLSLIREHFSLLQEEHGLFFGDELKSREQLMSRYRDLRQHAVALQL
mgnify:CR=1 FL=1